SWPARARAISRPKTTKPGGPAGPRSTTSTPSDASSSACDGAAPGRRPAPAPTTSRGQRRLDRLDDGLVLRLGPRPEPGQHRAVRADQELLEVPLDVPGLALG